MVDCLKLKVVVLMALALDVDIPSEDLMPPIDPLNPIDIPRLSIVTS